MLVQFESVAKRLQADFEETQAIAHPGLKGQAREKAITRDMLRQFLPKRFSVAGGIIVDSTGHHSQQQDLVVYDALTSPTLQDLGDNQVFFVEQVLTTIEVKSSLDLAELADMIQKGTSVASLVSKPQSRMRLAPGIVSGPSGCPNTSCGFAYTSPRDLYDICGILNERFESDKQARRPSAVLVLRDAKGRAGLVINTKPTKLGAIVVVPSDECKFAVVMAKTQGEALLYFYLILMERLQFDEVLPPRPNYATYAAAAGLPYPTPAIMWKAAERGKFLLDGKPMDIDTASSLPPLGMKLLSKRPVTDDDINTFFAGLVSLPVDNGFREGTFFQLDGQVWDEFTPAQVGAALAAWRTGTANDLDKRALARFAALVREIVSASRRLSVFDLAMSTLLMCFSPGNPVQLNNEKYILYVGAFRVLGTLPDPAQ